LTKNVKSIFDLIGDVHHQGHKNMSGGNRIFISEVTARRLKIKTSIRKITTIWWHKHVRSGKYKRHLIYGLEVIVTVFLKLCKLG